MILDKFYTVDLTHSLTSNVPTWSGSCGFSLHTEFVYDQMFRVQHIEMQAGIGTHMDAPSHLTENVVSIADFPTEDLIVSTCIIDVSKQAHADYKISVADIQKYEKEYGEIPSKALLIGFTGWARFWHDPIAYRNMDEHGEMHFPSFSSDAVEVLLERNISGLAIDTLSPDCSDPSYSVHKMVLGAGKYIVENIADCSRIPPKGATTIVLPLKIEGATESPVRMVALIPRKETLV